VAGPCVHLSLIREINVSSHDTESESDSRGGGMSRGIDQLVEAYFRCWSSEDKEDFDAWEEVTDTVERNPEAAWPLITTLLARAPSEEAMLYVAAGPLEDFLIEHGSAWLPQIRVAAAAANFRRALSGVWGRDRMSPDVRKEIERLEQP
jgi:hypothetical protein